MTETLTWGIIGTSRINRKVIPAIRSVKGTNLLAVASRTHERAEEFAEEYGIPKVYDSYEAILDNPKIDCVYIPLPNSLHAEWTMKAIEAGKHVLCEKPFTVDADEAVVVADVVNSGDRICMEAFMYRFHPQWERARTLIETGEIGEVKLIHSSFGFNLTDRTNIRLSGELAGGSLMDIGSYCVNGSRLITQGEPTLVSAQATFDPEEDVDVSLAGTMRFASGVTATFESSFDTAFRHTFEVVGTEGILTLWHPWTPGPEQDVSVAVNCNDHVETHKIPAADEYALQVKHFCQVVRGEDELHWTVDDAVRQMKVIDALKQSARVGKPVLL